MNSKSAGFKKVPPPPPKSNISPDNQWLEDEISFWNGPFSGDMIIFVEVTPLKYGYGMLNMRAAF